MMEHKDHWENVYRTKLPTEVSWYQPDAALSLRLIQEAVPDRSASLIDVGGGASVLGARLLESGYSNVTVLDLAGAALDVARARMGRAADRIQWIEGDVRQVPLAPARYGLWHDRAVFHFLTNLDDRAAYLRQLRRALQPGGCVVLATFAADGPTRCSGLEVRRYSPEDLTAELGPEFALVDSHREEHQTPSGAVQVFTYGVFRRGGLPVASRADAG